MASCVTCGADVDGSLAHSCSYCGGSYCPDHRLPENHNCAGIRASDTLGPNLTGALLDESPVLGVEEPEEELEDDGPDLTPCDECGRPCPPEDQFCGPCQADRENEQLSATRNEIADHWRENGELPQRSEESREGLVDRVRAWLP